MAQQGRLRRTRRALLAPLMAAIALAGCVAADVARIAPPPEGWRQAVALDNSRIRNWADTPAEAALKDERVAESVLKLRMEHAREEERPFEFNVLALSGGAADGAFGAGLLAGWSARGDRPEFDLVTGVSTGALIAPFAYLGQDYDASVRRLFTLTDTDGIIIMEPVKALFGALALGRSEPLREAIRRTITSDVIARIAEEHAKGRRMMIGTTNLDARRGVMWDMGAIASLGTPEAERLFRSVMLASASVPGAFPPVYIDVTVDGERYQEMHVDGGVAASVFVIPSWMKPTAKMTETLNGNGHIYVIQNNKITPNYGPTEDRLISIAGDAFSELIRAQTRGDQLRIYSIARRIGLDYRLAFVPEDFNAPQEEQFDPVYMRRLYEVGRRLGENGEAWTDAPPDLPAALRQF